MKRTHVYTTIEEFRKKKKRYNYNTIIKIANYFFII